MNLISKRRLRAITGITCITLACGVTAAIAQQQTLPRNQQELEKLIGITAAQKTQMQAIDKKYQPQLLVVQKKYQPQFEALQKQLLALQQKANAEAKPIAENRQKEIQKVLTPAQREKLKQLEAQLKAQQQKAMGGMPGQSTPPKAK